MPSLIAAARPYSHSSAASPRSKFVAHRHNLRRIPQACRVSEHTNEAIYAARPEQHVFLKQTDRTTGETPFSATYDAANRMSAISLHIAGSTKSYSLSYDAYGRRIQASITRGVPSASNLPDTVQYLYEGQQALGEIRNGNLSHRLLTGLSLDETIARVAINNGQADNVNTRIYMTDALNSVIAQLAGDSNATVQTSYGYSPYGQTEQIGPDATNNTSQYTSRENDNTGLYFYRARYYDPVLKRFISEDPIGLAGGHNMHGFVGGNPISYNDPTGNCPWCFSAVVGGIVGGGFNLLNQLSGDKPINWTSVAIATGSGAIGGATGAWVGQVSKSLGSAFFVNGVAGAGINLAAGALDNLANCKPYEENALNNLLIGAAFGSAGGVTGQYFANTARRFQYWANFQGAMSYSPASQNWAPAINAAGVPTGAAIGSANTFMSFD
jgi:RHS repeat-associated protein